MVKKKKNKQRKLWLESKKIVGISMAVLAVVVIGIAALYFSANPQIFKLITPIVNRNKTVVPSLAEQTVPAPAEQTVPAPAEQTVPSLARRIVSFLTRQTVPAPAEQTVPAPAEQTVPSLARQFAPAPAGPQTTADSNNNQHSEILNFYVTVLRNPSCNSCNDGDVWVQGETNTDTLSCCLDMLNETIGYSFPTLCFFIGNPPVISLRYSRLYAGHHRAELTCTDRENDNDWVRAITYFDLVAASPRPSPSPSRAPSPPPKHVPE